ncbi:Putative rRNA methylase [Alkalibacterium subtropicum]|uniref:Putative rRNA methylase n=1 Tax=Alkalibacterium subtropicum TaxID=753702 RepID=A0A1I1GU10_9LACT|nr:class I SAM-dependent methyltransferase [Alkalibacterium subtropicum]SFC13338.1 Putative rRNA methylase [Alkalibacterium subtropicum]
MLHSALSYTQNLMRQAVRIGDTVIDATVGNGHDTLTLAHCVGDNGQVIGFDIQKSALDTTQKKLIEAKLDHRVTLYHKGHEELNDVLSPSQEVSLVVYNLGYLPHGDKSIVTLPETTIKSIEQALDHLKHCGLLLLMIYYGHEGGREEMEAVTDYVKQLPQNKYSVLNYQFINQKHSPPFMIAIEKR